MTNAVEDTVRDFIARARETGDDLFVVKVSALEEMQHVAREELSIAGSSTKEAYVKGYIEALDHILEAAYKMRNEARQKGHANGVGFACSE